MAQFPALPLWTDAWIADTHHLTHCERGIYFDLIVLMWRTPGCRVPNDMDWLSRRLHIEAAAFKPIIEEFCQTDGNWLTQKRLIREYSYVTKSRHKRSVAAKRRWQKEKDLCNADAPTPTPTPTPIKNKKIVRVSRKHPIPETWQVPQRAIEIATELKVDWHPIEGQFRDYLSSTGKQYIDYDAAFCNFVRNAPKFNGGHNGPGRPRPLQDDSLSCSKAADRLIEANKRGEFTIAPYPSLIPERSQSNIRMLPKGRGPRS